MDESTGAFRLRAEIDDEMRTFPLPDGSHVLGSGQECDLLVAVRGVSRRHALLEVGQRSVQVQDLGSKNGTFLNGRRLDAAERLAAHPGDELRCGPACLELEAVDPLDADLGLELDTSSIFAGGRDLLLSEHSTWWTRGGGQLGRRHLLAFEAVVERLIDLPEPDVGGAVEDLVAGLGAVGGAMVEWSSGGGQRATLRVAVGQVGEVPSLDEFTGGRGGDLRWISGAPRSGVAAAWRQPDAVLGLILWGEQAATLGSDELLAALLRLLLRFGSAVTEDAGDEAEDSGPSLDLPEHIVRGRSTAMTALYQQMQMLLQGDVPVLILGETGVGKEHLAQTLHRSSVRGEGPFVAINCAAIPEPLLEAEMFGIGKGVATGVQARPGRFAEANGGTLFLDEVGEMPAPLQAKLLRALQEGVIHPVGLAPEPVDVRVVAATNADLRRRVDAGEFRSDLYYRLAGYELSVPPLRDRHGDVARLVGHFLRRFCRETRKPLRGVTVKAMQVLDDYAWPGNIRELEHEMRRLVYCCPRDQAIDAGMLSPRIRFPAAPDPSDAPELDERALDVQLQELEKRLVVRALERTGGNQTRAAKLLGVSRNGLAKRLRRLGLDAADFQA